MTPKETLEKIKQKLALVPTEPGVYLHKDLTGKVIYIGKAKNLKNRLKSYFSSKDLSSFKTSTLVEKIGDFDFILTKSEYESLILENNLIKHHKPHYNVLLKDDKTYPYVKIDLHDPWPQVILTRKKKQDGALYFGPFINSWQLDKILSIIHKYFPLVKCTKKTFKTISRPCNYYDIKKCLAPCHLPVEKSEYQQIVLSVVDLLKGKTAGTIQKLKLEMQTASNNLDFEKAAQLRDTIAAIDKLKETQSVTFNSTVNCDIVAFEISKSFFSFYIAHVRSGIFINTSSYVLENKLNDFFEAEQDSLEKKLFLNSFIQFYDYKEIPESVIFCDDKKLLNEENHLDLSIFLKQKRDDSAINLRNDKEENNNKEVLDDKSTQNDTQKTEIYYSSFKKFFEKHKSLIKEKSQFLELNLLSQRNALNKLEEKIKLDELVVHKLEDLKNFLSLKTFPRVIECYDISTFAGTSTVGARVVFKDGKPHKSLYRKYIIREINAQSDDFKSLREVLTRRMKSEDHSHVDLILIDGGTPQVREVSYLFKMLGLENICFVGIAKSRNTNSFEDTSVNASEERLIIPARDKNGFLLPTSEPTTLTLNSHSKSFALVTEIRNETHRFAITFHRQKRSSRSMTSILDTIEGLGQKRKKTLLKIYPDLKVLKLISNEEIVKHTKLPIKIIEKIKSKIE